MSVSARPEHRASFVVGALCIAAVAAFLQLVHGAFDVGYGGTFAALLDAKLWRSPATLVRLVLGDGAADALGLGPALELDTATLIVWSVRVPRVLLAVLVGACLSVSGTLLQGVTRNELASPSILGVSAGAGLAILLVLVLVPGLGLHLPLIASFGGFAAFLLVYGIAWSGGTNSVRLVLAGVVVAAIAGSVQTALFLLLGDLASIQDSIGWMTGSLTGADWHRVRVALPWTAFVVGAALVAGRSLDVLLLGDAQAKALGLSTERVRFTLAAVAVLAASTAIAVSGLIAFVGLIVPHVVRTTLGGGSRTVLLGCLAVGPAVLLVADTGARLLFSPAQLPVGVVTGVVGGVHFLILMRRSEGLVRP